MKRGGAESGKAGSRVQPLQRWCDKRFIAQQSPGQPGPLQPLYITSSSLRSPPCRGNKFGYVSEKYRHTEIYCRSEDRDSLIRICWCLHLVLTLNKRLNQLPECRYCSNTQMTYELLCDLKAPYLNIIYRTVCVWCNEMPKVAHGFIQISTCGNTPHL